MDVISASLGDVTLLFLLNDRVLKIAGGADLIAHSGLPISIVRDYSLADTILALQTVFMEDPNFHRNSPEKAAALVWLLHSKSNANSAVFVPLNSKPKKPDQIGYKLASTTLTILGALASLQEQGRLNNNVINENVWAKVA